MCLWVDEVVADEVTMSMMEVKIVQDEKTREPEPGIPEWARDPRIKVEIIPRRRIVSHDRRTFVVVIVINNLRIPVILRLLFIRVLPLVDLNRQTLLGGKILNRLGRLIPVHLQFAGIYRRADSILQLPDNIGRHGVIGNPTVFGRDTSRCQHTLRFRLTFR